MSRAVSASHFSQARPVTLMYLSAPPPPPSAAPPPAAPRRPAALSGSVDSSAPVPAIALNVDRISHAMAARLTLCLLGHVLYLNSQIPFPLAQLINMISLESEHASPQESTNTPERTLQKRKLFLTTLDTFSSHLRTTFTALSTALARNERDHPPPIPPQSRRNPAKVHLAVVLGPSVSSLSAAKARTIFEIDGFDVALWGERADKRPLTDATEEEEESEDDDDNASSDSASAPPDSESDDDQSDCDSQDESDSDEVPPVDVDSEEALRIAERLMSRALAMANADVGLGADIPPTQTSILLRAPRRFEHPAWVPRQQLGKDMDKLVRQVFVDTTPNTTHGGKGRGRLWGGVKTGGMRVSCARSGEDKEERSEEETKDEDDELIWWSWDGKLVGLGDW